MRDQRPKAWIIWRTHLASALGASVLGSLILWLLIGLHPESTAGFTLSLLLSILYLSTVVVVICSSIILGTLYPLAGKLAQMSTLNRVSVTTMIGALCYLAINLAIAALSGSIGQFLTTGAFIFPLVVGVIYGASYGLVHSRLRKR